MNRRAALYTLAILTVCSIAVALLARESGPMGLRATVSPADSVSGGAAFAEHDATPSFQSAQRFIDTVGAPARIRWDGYLFVTEAREYELRVVASAPATLWIDGRVVFATPGSPDPPAVRVSLPAGARLIGIDFGPAAEATALELQWDVGNPYRLAHVPPERMSPRPLRGWRWAVHRRLPTVALALCAAWSLAMLWTAWVGLWRLSAPYVELSRGLVLTLVIAAALFVVGIEWGGIGGWQADAIDPESVRQALAQRFAGGWHDKYPPLHYYLLAVLHLPTFVAHHLGWLTVHAEDVQLVLTLTSRLLSVVMALGTVLAVAVLTAQATDGRHAWPAALCAAAFLPMAFYAKTTNVDLPFVCWYAWSLVFLARLVDDGELRRRTLNAIALGITSAAAVGTKDQAYGLYVLPAVMLVWRFGRSLAGCKVLAVGAVAALAALAVIYNVALNPHGLPLHIEFVRGPASTGYRMFAPTPIGQWHLLLSTAGQLLFTLGISGTILVMAGLVRLPSPRARRVLWWLAFSIVSYYVTFIAYAGYVYDRFLLPVTCALAVPAAIALRRLLDGPSPLRALGLLLTAWIVARAATIDYLLVRDSRIAAERWLAAHVQKNEVVGAVNQYGHIPRVYRFKRLWMTPTIEFTEMARPAFVVVNREHSLRSGPGTAEYAWLAWLESGAGPYEEAFRCKTSVAWTPLGLDRRFSDRTQDPFTNLDKINPEIVIFRRRTHP